MLGAALCFAAGAAFGKVPMHVADPAVVLLAAVVSCAGLTALALSRSSRVSVIPLAGLWVAAGVWGAQVEPAASRQTAVLAYADGLSRTVEGRVTRIRTLPPRGAAMSDADEVDWEEPGDPVVALDLDLTAIEEVTPDVSRLVPVQGGVRATVLAGALPPVRCGDLIEAPVRLRVPQRFRDPGAWQYADFLLDQGIAATANVPAAKVRRMAVPSRGSVALLRCRIADAQSWAAERLMGYGRSGANRRMPGFARLSGDDVGMLNAMLFGDRSRLNHELRVGFERTGSFHLFVVSGMHVALLAGGLFWIGRRLRLREWLATAVTLCVTAAYAALTGLGIPVQRALLMTAVFLVARLLSRERNVANALGAAALAVLVGMPRSLFEASFQMTFLAIVAIAGIAIPLGEWSFLPYARAAREIRSTWLGASVPPRIAQCRVMLRVWGEAVGGLTGGHGAGLPAGLVRGFLYAAELALIGVVAEAVMVLPMAFYFHRATVFALPANMVSIPLVALLAPLAVLTFLASLVSSWAAVVPGAMTAGLLHAITFAIGRVSRSQAADLRVPGPTVVQALGAAACVGFACWAVRRSRGLAWGGLAALPLAVVLALWPARMDGHPGQLEVTAIDVGQGDSLLVVGPGGRTMLVDAGGPTGAAANAENAAGSTSFDVGEEVVSPYLWTRRVRRLDVVALTHAHSDHMGGMPAVLRNFRPRELWVGVDASAPAYRALVAEAAALGIAVRHFRAGDKVTWDGVQVDVFAPGPGYTNRGPPANNDSLVMHLQFGEASVLLEGRRGGSERAGDGDAGRVDAGDAAEGGAPWEPDVDDAGVFCAGDAAGCGDLGGAAEHVRAPAAGGDWAAGRGAYAAVPDGRVWVDDVSVAKGRRNLYASGYVQSVGADPDRTRRQCHGSRHDNRSFREDPYPGAGRGAEADPAAAVDDEPGDADGGAGQLADDRRGVADDCGQPEGGAGDVSGERAGVRPDLEAAVSAVDAGAVPDYVICQGFHVRKDHGSRSAARLVLKAGERLWPR